MKNGLLVLMLLSIFVSPVWGDATRNEPDFHSLVVRYYSFSPSKLSKEEKESKSKILDSFWSMVSSDRVTLVPKLREELERTDNPAFFYYDGSKLLLSLSKETRDKQLAVTAIARTDLSEIQPEDYLRTIMKLGTGGMDTSNAAFRVLDYPDFTVVVPAHSLKLGQDYSLILMLYQLPEPLLVEKAINRLEREKGVTAMKSLLRVLWCTVTSSGDKTIARVAGDTAAPSEVRAFAARLLDETKQITSLPVSAIEKLRKQLALNRALLKAAPILSANQKDRQMSKEQIEVVKLFMEALRDSEEEGAKKMLLDFAKNTDGSLPKEVSNYADTLLKGKGQSDLPVLRPLSQDDVAKLKKLRQTVLSAITDEVLYDFDSITVLLRWNQSKETGQQMNENRDVGSNTT